MHSNNNNTEKNRHEFIGDDKVADERGRETEREREKSVNKYKILCCNNNNSLRKE